MEYDDGEHGKVGCLVVPKELVEHLIAAAFDAMDEWHEENNFPLDLVRCSAAISIASEITMNMLKGADSTETLQ